MLGFGGEREPVSKVGLTAADLAAARRREPAAVTRVYTAYAPALFRFFMAAVSPTLDTASRSPPKPSTQPPDAPCSPVRLSHAPATGQMSGRVRPGRGRPQKNSFRLKLPLERPQNATDVITIVTFQSPMTV